MWWCENYIHKTKYDKKQVLRKFINDLISSQNTQTVNRARPNNIIKSELLTHSEGGIPRKPFEIN